MPLFFLALAWLVGIIAANALSWPLTWWAVPGATGALGALPLRGRARLVALCLVCGALGAARFELAHIPTTPRSIWLLAGSAAQLEGVIVADPKRTEDGQQLILEVEAVLQGVRTLPAEGRVLVKLPPYPVFSYGQRLLLRGSLQTPREAERLGDFNYRDYLARKGIFVLIDGPKVRVLAEDAGNPALRALLGLRARSQAVLLRSLPEPQASLAVGILLGLQSSIPDEVYNTFSVTGTSHILVVSGWNMTIIGTMLAAAATRLRVGRQPTFWVTLAVIWTYALFVGATATVLRAAAMASLAVFARNAGRSSEPWTLLAAACWAMTLWDPQTLWDLGFQLSAAATASLFAYGKGTERLLQHFPPLRWPQLAFVAEALTATLAAQILALPIILYQFGN